MLDDPRATQQSPAMAETAPEAPEPKKQAAAAKPTAKSEARDLIVFLIKLVVIVTVIRSLLFAPFSIPSESMLPRTLIGDYLFVTKWNYGYSRFSFPFSPHLFDGRILGSLPKRGDVVVFKAPPADNEDWIKRVIGLPGDTVQMRHGQLFLNGKAIPKVRIADFILPITPNYPDTHCLPQFQDTDAAGKPVCRYKQYRETLPNGVSYNVLDWGENPIADDTQVYHVPADHLFMMGDNRDDSEDSRFPQVAGEGIGMVPFENLEGKAVVTFWSTDGAANWFLPWTWVSAARWNRIGRPY